MTNKILLKFGKELERLKNECEIVESEEYILNKYEDDNSIYLKAIDINNKINTLLKKLEKINKEYKLLKNNNLIEEPLLLDDSLLIDDIINYRKTLQKEEINKIPKKIKLLEEYKYLYKNLDDLVEKTEKMKEISNKRVQELSARDKKYKDAKNKIVNLEEVENCCNLIIEKNNNYLEELSKKVDKISERKYVESKLKGMNGFLTSSLRYIWLLSLTPLRGILPGIGARTVATRKLLHNMLKNMHYEKQEKIIYSLGNYESEINNKIYDIDSLIDVLKKYVSITNRRLTFEYILLDNVNDSKEDALKLVKLLKGINCYVNLIPYNETNSGGFKRSSKDKILAFFDILKKNNIQVTIRREFGSKVTAACGQLRANYTSKGVIE